MKRHESLAPLSRDHHGALILARLLQTDAPAYKGLPSDVKGKAKYAKQFYEDQLVSHFKDEETALNSVKGTSPEMDDLINRVFKEHTILTKMFLGICDNEISETANDELGKFLESHVRLEERELFPMMQEQCEEEKLQSISQLLSH